MTARHLVRLSCVLAAALATLLATTLPASAGGKDPGTRSLAAVLAADGAGFDKNPYDYDILDNAVTAVLTAKPTSAVAVLADGSVPLTAFLPNDRAFAKLAKEAVGGSYKSESAVFAALAGALPIDTIESVLLYHVVPGATITYRQALRSNGATLNTALAGATIKVKVRYYVLVQLRDADTNDRNPYVVQPNINKGNLQIAHGIDRVLRPIDLP